MMNNEVPNNELPNPEADYIAVRRIEVVLYPLVSQIASLINHKEKFNQSEKTQKALVRICQAVNVAVERFVTVGEAIGDDNPEVKLDMYDACKDARSAGIAIEKLCEVQFGNLSDDVHSDKATLIRASRLLLSSITRVLLAADRIVVQQLIQSKEKVSNTLNKLESVINFAEFVKAFSQFGAEMVEFAYLTADRQNDLKEERRQALIMVARRILERSTILLLTSSKMCMRHPSCLRARENRDTVFMQIRKSMDMIHSVVKEGIMSNMVSVTHQNLTAATVQKQTWKAKKIEEEESIEFQLKKFQQNLKRVSASTITHAFRENLISNVQVIIEATQDFTDSAYTSHESRENIIILCDRIKLELNHFLRVGLSLLESKERTKGNENFSSSTLVPLMKATNDLRQQLFTTALEHASFLLRGTTEDSDTLSAVKSAALAGDAARLQESCDNFKEHAEHIKETCRLLRHIAHTEFLQIAAWHTLTNLSVYGTQVLLAATALCLRPSSKAAKVNLDAFSEMWRTLVTDVTHLTREVDEIHRESTTEKKQLYLSLPRPGEQEKIARAGLEMKLISSQMDAETNKWLDSSVNDDNEIVKIAKNLTSMVLEMYRFTRGEGLIRTTQELFTQAEYFAEESNALYKVVRQFSYQVPSSPIKKELLQFVDRIPTYVQQLQFTVKNPTVGKAATFLKVDKVIHETRNLINVISRVVTICFICAAKYSLDFQGLSQRMRNHLPYRSENEDPVGFSTESTKAYAGPTPDQNI